VGRTLTEGPGLVVLLADFEEQENSPWRIAEVPRRFDGRTWGAFVSEVDGVSVLNARDAHPSQLGKLFEFARQNYSVVCVDLTGARESAALAVMRASDGIFLVAGSDAGSLAAIAEKADWLRSADLGAKSGLLLRVVGEMPNIGNAEEITGLPLCSLVDTDEQIAKLAEWLAFDANSRSNAERSQYALAG
jgi:hypothetical protein